MPEIPSLSDQEQRRIENLTSPHSFRTLLQFTAEACLNREFTPHARSIDLTQHEQNEARVIADLGLAGVRAAVELSEGFNKMSRADSRQGILPDVPIKTPERFSDGLDDEALRLTREFGEALLDEAFDCLGEDAPEYAALFTEAKTETEQSLIVAWLDDRLKNIARYPGADRYGETDGSTVYHPARLSPKLIGTYPDIKTAPTCLGLSILATSFFHKTGAEVLHAGLMTQRHDAQSDDLLELCSVVPPIAREKYGIHHLPDELSLSLDKVMLGVVANTIQHDGYHAATYVRLKQGSWIQVDPNFSATTLIRDDEAERGDSPLTHAFKTIKEMENISPGLELGVNLDFATFPRIITALLITGDRSLLVSDDDIREKLLNNKDISQKQLKSWFIDCFFDNHEDQELVELYRQCAFHEDTVEEISKGVFDKYVLKDCSVESVLKKCQEDKAYLEARVEDMRLLPLIVLANMALYDVNAGSDTAAHQHIEVGLPASRIGAAVLSDFMNYFARDIPPSFRMSQWPSLVPLTETIGDARSDAQRRFVEDNFRRSLSMLNYRRTRGIIVKSLDDRL